MLRATRLIVIAAAVAIAAPTSAHAQFSGLKNKLKKKVEAAAGVKDGDSASGDRGADRASRRGATASAPGPSGPRFDDRILEMTPEVLERLASSLEAERRGRADAARALSPETRQKFQACEQQVLTSPEAAKILERFSAANERQDMAASRKESEALNALRDRKCGMDPSTGAFRDSVTTATTQATLRAGRFTPEQYSLLKERVTPFCKGAVQEVGDGARVGGSGREIYYVYSKREVEALRPRCGELSKAIAATM
ncbi:MAG TPA: hypothetical protein VF041_09750 [Gemmatimonadaceae bacterium]